MSESHEHGNVELVTLIEATSEFAAHAIVVVLEDAGIPAVALETHSASLPIGRFQGFGTPVQVRKSDLELARRTLDQTRQDSVDIDWDQVELGEREDTLPLSKGGVSMMLVLGFTATALVLLLGVVAAIWTTLT